jgi:hypothetical protein
MTKDKRSESQFPDVNNHDMPEGVDWSWTAESQQEMADDMAKNDKISRMAESLDKTNAQHYNSRRSRGE